MIYPTIEKGLSHVRLLIVEAVAIIVILWAEVHACIYFGYLNESVVEPPKGSKTLQIKSDGYAAARALADDGRFDVENVVTISTAEELRSITNDLDGDYVLANDIDLQNEPWEPIGTSGDGAFRGTFDGNGHTISGLNISGTYRGEKASGLFGMVVGGCIRRLRVTGTIQVSTTSSGGNEGTILAVGGIAAALSHAAILDCSVDMDIVAAGTGEALPRAGGICGIAKESLIRNCTAYGSVRASATKGRNCSVGFISGRMVSGTNADTVIANCYVQGYVDAVYSGWPDEEKEVARQKTLSDENIEHAVIHVNADGRLEYAVATKYEYYIGPEYNIVPVMQAVALQSASDTVTIEMTEDDAAAEQENLPIVTDKEILTSVNGTRQSYRVPHINLAYGMADAINAEIEAISDTYNYYYRQEGNLLSIIMERETDEGYYAGYTIRCVDTDTGKQLSNQEVVQQLGLSQEDYKGLAQDAINEYLSANPYMGEDMLSDENIAVSQIYVNSEGHLGIAACMDSDVGDGSAGEDYVLLDTGIALDDLKEAVAARSSQDAQEFTFADLTGYTFMFNSGAGAWGTTLSIESDGSFSGVYQDSNMGDVADDHPNGGMDYCAFSGKFAQPQKIDNYTYAVRIQEISYENAVDTEEIKDGVIYRYTYPYGLDGAEDIYIYLPGRTTFDFSEPMKSWVYGAIDQTNSTLTKYVLNNAAEETCFYAYME